MTLHQNCKIARHTKIAFKIISKMLKQPNFFYSQPSTLPKEALAKFYLSTIFELSFMVSSVAPTRSSTFYAYLVTKIGNHARTKTFQPRKLMRKLMRTFYKFIGRYPEFVSKFNKSPSPMICDSVLMAQLYHAYPQLMK